MARLILKAPEGDRAFVVGDVATIGRLADNTICVSDAVVSKRHCVVERRGDGWVVLDLGSANGTSVNGARIGGATRLAAGDVISVGVATLIFDEGTHALEAPMSQTRFLAHLTTDKPLYRPGETIYARAALLDAFSREPVAGDVLVAFEVRSPKGDVVASVPGRNERGVAAFAWTIPNEQAGGEHKLCATFPREGAPSAELAFSIRAYRVPRLKLDLEFARKAYGPGDDVVAALHAERAEGGLPIGARVTAIATVDGVEVHRGDLALDVSGDCEARFRLPEEIADGDGTLVLVVRDGGVEESVARTIPIVVSRLRVSFFPEGGDLVMGLPTRLYVEARTPKDKPADVAGRIVDGSGALLASFRTEHEGRGRVAITPVRAGRAYMAVLDEPAGVSDFFPLPEVARAGFSLACLDDAVGAEETVHLRVGASAAGKVRVTLSSREREVAAVRVDLAAGDVREVALTPPSTADGVLRATLYDAAGLPRAERLVFRRPTRSLRVEVEAAPAKSTPRASIKVRVRTRDAEGQPVRATVTLAIVDDAVLETIERRERAPRLAVQALLGSEVRELFDPGVYLAPSDAAATKLDLLLGTQGWRRFAFYERDKFTKAHGDKAEHVLAELKPPPPPPPPPMPFPRAAPFPMRAGGPPPPMAMAGLPDFGPPPPPGFGPPQAAAFGPPPVAGFGPPPAPAFGAPPGFGPPPAPAFGAPPGFGPPPAAPAAFAPPPPPAFAPPPMFAPPPAPPLEMARARRAPAPPAPPQVIAVREYAHRASRGEGRTDFAETLYWNAGITTSTSGDVEVAFDLADSITTFAVRADAFGSDGALGGGEATIEARRPFYVEPKLPLEVSAGDRVDAPIALVNGSAASLAARLAVNTSPPLDAPASAAPPALAPEARVRVIVPIAIGAGNGTYPFELDATAGDHADRVSRTISVVPAGFPVELHASGRIGPGDAATHALRLPDVVFEGSITTELALYPTPLASLTQALEALLREPCGCFEQASSSTYPNIMVLQYLASHHGAEPRLLQRASELIERGYQRLVGYECKEKGYEWFGGDPGHEALTAYGVMEFADMARVFSVDEAMLSRTRAWLLARRDPGGGFTRNPRALDSFGGAPQDITDAYITWALGQSATPGLEKEIATIRTRARTSKDAYYLGLAANVLLDARDAESTGVLAKLASLQESDGALRRASTSITRSGGDNLAVETTSLAILAWLRAPEHMGAAERAMEWLVARCKGGRFGATQATVLALKAIVAFDAAQASAKAPGKVRVSVNGRPAGEVAFSATKTGTIELPSFAAALSHGEAKVHIAMEGGSAMPYSLRVRCSTREPASAPECKVDLATSISRTELGEGEAADVRVEIVNRTDEGLPMVVALVGLPGGMEARADQLKELVAERTIDFWELRGREVALYRRSMAPRERASLTLSVIAAVPGSYEGPASRAYLYYTDEHKTWAPPLRARIVASR